MGGGGGGGVKDSSAFWGFMVVRELVWNSAKILHKSE